MSYKPTPEEWVRRLRLNMLIHSYIYYVKDENIISDHQWQAMADTLTMLHSVYGFKWDCYDDQFVDWNGSTGMHLSYDDWVQSKAEYLLRNFNSQEVY